MARSKLNSIEKGTYKELIDSDISHEERSYFRLKENIRAKDNDLGDIEKDRLIEYNKGMRQNERQSLKLKIKVENSLKL